MAKRTRKHVIGDIASNQVQLVFLEAEWVVNTIPSDYGEDLIVSPTRDENVDTFHLLVQVKGKDEEVTELQDGRWSRSFAPEHIERWIRMREPVAVVLWSLKDGCGRYCIPREQHNISDLLATVRARKEKKPESDQTVTLHFNKDNALTKGNLSRLAWEFRLAYAADTSENYRAAHLEVIEKIEEERISIHLSAFGRSKRQIEENIAQLEKDAEKARADWDERLDEVLQLLGVMKPPRKIHDDLISEWNAEQQYYIDPDTNPDMSDDEIHAAFCRSWLARSVIQQTGAPIQSSLAEALAERLLRLWPTDDEGEIGVETEIAEGLRGT